MPINYQAPQGAGSAYMHAASNFSPGAAAELIGREEALGQQQTLQNQRLLFEGGQQANLESARLQAAAAAQERHAQLQVWVNGQEMTQAEQMQLRQDQNAIAWINSQRDKTLTGQEADDAIAQRMARVNLGQQRLQAMELKQKSQLLTNEQFKGQILQAHAEMQKSGSDSNRVVLINDAFAPEADEYATSLGLTPGTPEFKAARLEHATANGEVTSGWRQADGTTKPDATAKSTAGTAAGKGVDLDAAHHGAAFEKAFTTVAAMAKATNADGAPAHPELQDIDAQIAAASKIAKGTAAHVTEQLAAKKVAAKADTDTAVAAADAHIQETMTRTDLPTEVRDRASNLMRQVRDLTRKYSANPSAAMKARILKLTSDYEAIAGPIKKPAQQQQPGNPPAAAPAAAAGPPGIPALTWQSLRQG